MSTSATIPTVSDGGNAPGDGSQTCAESVVNEPGSYPPPASTEVHVDAIPGTLLAQMPGKT